MPKATAKSQKPQALDIGRLGTLVSQNNEAELLKIIADPQTPKSLWTELFAGAPLLCYAVDEGSPKLIKAMLGVCDVNQASEFGDTPFMTAAMNGRLDMVKLLLPLSDANAQNRAGQTALMLAIDGIGNGISDEDQDAAALKCVKEIAPASDLSVEDDHGLTAIQLAASHASAGGSEETLWKCADFLAERSNRAEAMRVFEEAPEGEMPKFKALLAKEAKAAGGAPAPKKPKM